MKSKMGLHGKRILPAEWASGCMWLAIRSAAYAEESAQSPHCQV